MTTGILSFRVLFWKAFIRLVAYDVRFGRNFARLHRAVREWTVSTVKAPAGTIERVCEAVNHACVWYPKHVLCLQRSFATACLLRQCGIPAQLVMGAQQLPFKAHAWVEVDGCAVNEENNVTLYSVWERC